MKLKKFEQKDRHGNMFSIEFDTSVPEMSMIPNHPGKPKGTDTVPAWLTPGEFVMNAEAVRMFEPQIEQMNNAGRTVQAAQGGTIPMYAAAGEGVPLPKPKPEIKDVPALDPQQLYTMLRKRDFTDAAARGIMGNFYAESNLDPDSRQILSSGETGAGRGLAQWESGGRFNTDPLNLVDFSNERGTKWTDPETQLDFMIAEMENSEAFGNVRNQMNQAKTPEEAAKIFLEGYEKANPEKARLDKRTEYASNFQPQQDEPSIWSRIFKSLNPIGSADAAVPQPTAVPSKPEPTALGLTPDQYKQFEMQQLARAEKDVRGKDYDDLGTVGDIFVPEITALGLTPDQYKQFEMQQLAQAERDVRGEDSDDLGTVGDILVPEITDVPPTKDEIKDWWEDTQAEMKQVTNLGGSGIVIDSPEDVLAAAERNEQIASNQLDIEAESGNVADIKLAAETLNESANKADVVANSLVRSEAHANMQGTKKEAEAAQLAADQAQKRADALADAGLIERAAQAQAKADALAVEANTARTIAEEAAAKEDLLYDEDGKAIINYRDKDTLGAPSQAQTQQQSEVLTAIANDIQSIDDGSAAGTTEAQAEGAVANAGADGNDKVNKAESFLQGIFGDLFDTGELKRMAILYAGSRLMGGSHGGSLNWAAKQYLTRVDAKAADRAATIKELIKDGKYTPKTIQKFAKTGDASVLIPIGEPIYPTGTKEMWYSPEGKRIQAEKFKVGEGYIWSADGGKTAIPSSWHQQASRVPTEDAYNDRIKSEVPLIKGVLEEVANRIDVTPGDAARGIKRSQKTAIDPTDAAMEVARWAAKNGIDVATASGYAKLAYQMAVEQSGGPNKTQPESLLPYLNQLKLRQDTGQHTLFQVTKEDGRVVSMDAVKVEALSNNVLRLYGLEGKISDGRNRDAVNQFWTSAAEIWNNKVNENPDIVDIYQKKAGPNSTAFYAYAQEQLNLAMINR